MGWRSENLFGEGYTDPCAVMAHEVFQLGNADILLTLAEGVLKNSPIRERLISIANAIGSSTENNDVTLFLDEAFENEEIGQHFFAEIVDEIERITGRKLKSVLWLCDSILDIKEEYDPMLDVFDEYEEGFVVLSDIGKEGKLYGYESKPVPIRTISDNDLDLGK